MLFQNVETPSRKDDGAAIAPIERSRPTAPPPLARKAVMVARQIAGLIIEQGWVVGSRVGTEASLMRDLDVGRNTFREAVRILERQDVLLAQKGNGGGLIVKAPALEAVSNIIRNHIELSDNRFNDVMEAYEVLMHLIIDRASARMTPAHANDLRQACAANATAGKTRYQEGIIATKPLWAMSEIGQNACLSALTFMLHRLVADFAHQERCPAELWDKAVSKVHHEVLLLVDQVIARNPHAHDTVSRLHALTRRNIRQLERTNPGIWSTRSFLHGAYASSFLGRPGQQKVAVTLSYKIAATIQRAGLPAGAPAGTEATVAAAYKVGGAVAAEALRMLEFLGIIAIRRGRSAGAVVIDPDPMTVIDTASLYMSYYASAPDELGEVRRVLERAAIKAAVAARPYKTARQLIRRIDMACTSRPELSPALLRAAYQDLLALSGNRVLSLLIAVLTQTLVHAASDQVNIAHCIATVAKANRALDQALDRTDANAVGAALQSLCSALGQTVIMKE